MGVDKQEALRQLNSLIQSISYELDGRIISNVDSETSSKYSARLTMALKRLAPPNSAYLEALDDDSAFGNLCEIYGAVQALRDDYQDNAMETFRELMNAELEDDFLNMAEFLLQDERLKQPAAVLAGGVLEEHLRKLCDKNGIDTTTTDSSGKQRPKKADTMNADLRKGGVYNQNEQKQVTAWLAIRNSAAHSKHDEYDERDVEIMIMGLRSFILKYPA